LLRNILGLVNSFVDLVRMLASELLYLIDELAEIGHESALPFRRLKAHSKLPAVLRQARPGQAISYRGRNVRWGGWGSNPRLADHEKYGPRTAR
jgi:hypothetical protein